MYGLTAIKRIGDYSDFRIVLSALNTDFCATKK